MKIIIYQSNLYKIGGVETFTYNMAKNLSKYYDVMVLYRNCAKEQLRRIKQFVRIEKYDESKDYTCDICILASTWGEYPDKVVSTKNEYWQMIHANYKELAKTGYKYTKWAKTTKHIAVSDTVRDIFNEMYNENAITVYNLLDKVQKTQPILKLVSATRLSAEKGYNRMIQLANKLKEAKVKFRWTIFSDLDLYGIKPPKMEEVIFMKPTFDLWDYVKEADYGVQLSDTEGYSYFVNECLQYGTPMITTNFDSAKESVIDGVNGYILDMDLSNLDIDKLVNSKLKGFEYKPKTDVKDWIKLLGKPEKKENYKPEEYKVKSLVDKMFFVDEDIHAKIGTEFIVEDKERLNYLLSKNAIEEIK